MPKGRSFHVRTRMCTYTFFVVAVAQIPFIIYIYIKYTTQVTRVISRYIVKNIIVRVCPQRENVHLNDLTFFPPHAGIMDDLRFITNRAGFNS